MKEREKPTTPCIKKRNGKRKDNRENIKLK